MTINPYSVTNPNVTLAVIELFGGDNNLSDYVQEDMSEMVLGASGDICVIALADVFNGPAKVIEIAPGSDVKTLEDIGEIDTGDPVILARFLARALASFSPTTRIAIGFWDHGSGVFDEFDRNPLAPVFPDARLPRWRQSRSRPARELFFGTVELAVDQNLRAMLHDSQSGGLLTNKEAARMLREAFAAAGRTVPVDMIFSDTCLNGMAEVVAELGPFARFVVGSEELEPGDGWDYYEWFSRIGNAAPADAEAWAIQAVEAMEAGYLGRPDAYPVTMAAVKADNQIAPAFKAVIDSADQHGRNGFRYLDWARSQSQIFASGHDSYDLLDFTSYLVANPEIPAIAQAAENLAGTVREAIVHSIALGETVARATGLAFWFPSSKGSLAKDVGTYSDLVFDRTTGWTAYLSKYR